MIKLTRLTIVKQLSPSTPLCVVIEIARAHGVILDEAKFNDLGYISSIISTIHNIDVPNIASEPKAMSDLRLIARFINSDPSCIWTNVTCLKHAWQFLKSYMSDGIVPMPSSFKHGQQTQEAPELLNACVLYRLCQQCRINTNYLSSLQDMAASLKYSILPTDQLISNLTISLRERMPNRTALVDALLAYQQMPVNKDNTISHERLAKVADKFKGELYLAINPISKEEAIYLSAYYFGLDISAAENPLLEYEVVRGTLDLSKYVPADPNLLEIFKQNPRLLKLDFTFNPRLPETFYTKSRLLSLATLEGYAISSVAIGYYHCLQTAYLSETFYHGHHGGLTDKETAIQITNIKDVPLKELILYGIRDVSLKAYSCDELAEYMERVRSFVAPSGKKVFSKEAIRKLLNIAKLINTQASQRLMSIVKSIELTSGHMSDEEAQLLTTYSIAKQAEKATIVNSLYLLLKLAMYMRGWDGKNAYPISVAPGPGYGTAPKQEIIDTNVTGAMAEFENNTDLLSKPSLIYTLPIYKLVDGTYQLVGQSLRQRIEIVRHQGDETASCIRLTSNVFAVSAHKYLSELGLDPKFKLSDLILVS